MRREKQNVGFVRIAKLFLGLALGMSSTSAAVTITPSTLPNAVTGTPYSISLAAAGGTAPYSWSGSGSFPPGLQITSAGVLSGTPTQVGNFTFLIQAIDSTGASATSSFSISVSAGTLTITTISPLFNATVGSPYSQQFQASGGQLPYSWSITAGQVAPFTLNASTGVLQGTPTSPATLTFTVQVGDAAHATASQVFSLNIAAPPLVISTAIALPSAAVGISYAQPFAATGGLPPYTWILASGAVPGLSLDPVGGRPIRHSNGSRKLHAGSPGYGFCENEHDQAISTYGESSGFTNHYVLAFAFRNGWNGILASADRAGGDSALYLVSYRTSSRFSN